MKLTGRKRGQGDQREDSEEQQVNGVVEERAIRETHDAHET